MPSDDLKGFQGSSEYQLNMLINSITLSGDWSDFRATAREVCDHFLTLGAASLLADMKPHLFFINLCRSAENWRRFLLSSQQHFKVQPTLIYHSPLHAAIIANEKTLLQSLLKAMPANWQAGEEYEDQFHVCWLHLLLANNQCQIDDKISQRLKALENSEPNDIKSSLFKSLLGIDDLAEVDFWSRFDDALYLQEEVIAGKLQSVATNISQFIAHRFIWFEGLVWMRLAILKGYSLPSKEYKFCPDEVLQVIPQNYQNDWLLIPVVNA